VIEADSEGAGKPGGMSVSSSESFNESVSLESESELTIEPPKFTLVGLMGNVP
jgi:hypothetical protein